jgi:hypothetical protein
MPKGDEVVRFTMEWNGRKYFGGWVDYFGVVIEERMYLRYVLVYLFLRLVGG